MVGPVHPLHPLAARRPLRVGDEAGDDGDAGVDVGEALLVEAGAELGLERADLVQDVDDLAAGVGEAEDAGLAEEAVGREDDDCCACVVCWCWWWLFCVVGGWSLCERERVDWMLLERDVIIGFLPARARLPPKQTNRHTTDPL